MTSKGELGSEGAALDLPSRVGLPAAEDGEAALIAAAIAGEANAFARLYDAHVPRVYRHIYYQVGNKQDAEDLTQQVFLKAWRAIKSYRVGRTPFIAWLLAVANNTVISHRRRSRDESRIDIDPVARGRWADPEATTLAHLDRETVRRTILRLKPDQRQVVLMRFMEHFDYAEIAAALGKSEGNVRVIQHRALAEMRRLLEGDLRWR